jgi:nucleotide-binding cobW/hypB/ureG-like protein
MKRANFLHYCFSILQIWENVKNPNYGETSMIICQIAGFLGSGKTTLLIRLGTALSAKGKRVAIIVNEVGEVGVDGSVIDSSGLKSVELAEGCICCSLSGSLQHTLKQIKNDYDPDLIIIEPTGIAFPTKIVQLVRTAMVGEERMITISLIDAFRAVNLFKEAELFVSRQIAGADIVAVNKIDAVDEDTIKETEKIVKKVNREAQIVFISAKNGDGVDNLIKLLEAA